MYSYYNVNKNKLKKCLRDHGSCHKSCEGVGDGGRGKSNRSRDETGDFRDRGGQWAIYLN